MFFIDFQCFLKSKPETGVKRQRERLGRPDGLRLLAVEVVAGGRVYVEREELRETEVHAYTKTYRRLYPLDRFVVADAFAVLVESVAVDDTALNRGARDV